MYAVVTDDRTEKGYVFCSGLKERSNLVKGKKLFCLLLCCLLGFSLFGCSKAEEAQAPATPPLEISLLQGGKFAVTCEQFISAYEDVLEDWIILEEDDGVFQLSAGYFSAKLGFSKSGGEGKNAVEADLHEKMDTIAVFAKLNNGNYGVAPFVALIRVLNPDMSFDEAEQIWDEMGENLPYVSENYFASKKVINGVTFTHGLFIIGTGIVALTASIDPNVTIQI